jgi:hypothetical protein
MIGFIGCSGCLQRSAGTAGMNATKNLNFNFDKELLCLFFQRLFWLGTPITLVNYLNYIFQLFHNRFSVSCKKKGGG